MFGKLFRVLAGGRAGVEQNAQTAAETRRIAISELQVPEAFYNEVVLTEMPELQRTALIAQDTQKLSHNSWPRLLAITIYSSYQFDCQKTLDPSHYATRRLAKLGITPEQIKTELARNGKEVMRQALYQGVDFH